jgi:cysteine synthase
MIRSITPCTDCCAHLEQAATPRGRAPAPDHAPGCTELLAVGGIVVKQECTNPTGSIKDRVARFMLEEAMKRGELAEGDIVVEATSGNTGIALAHEAARLGCRLIVFMPEHMSPERAHMIRRLGGDVQLTPERESFAGAVARRDAFRGRPGHYVPDQFGNPDNVRCHQETTGRELVEQVLALGWTRVDAFVAGIGTGGTLMGVGRALRAAFPKVRLVAVEPSESAVLSGGHAGAHGIAGIGDGFVPAIVDRAAIDEVVRVSTHDALETAKHLRTEFGHCVGVSSGANSWAAFRLARRLEHVATVWPDAADRYGSAGLLASGAAEVTCPHADRCRTRSRWLLEGAAEPM